MVKRKKKLKKGIDSLQVQLDLHKKKQADALEKGNLELVDYYSKEMLAKQKDKEKKQKILDKQ